MNQQAPAPPIAQGRPTSGPPTNGSSPRRVPHGPPMRPGSVGERTQAQVLEDSEALEGSYELAMAPPSWIVQSGTGLVAAALLFLLLLATVVRYPEIVNTEVRIVTQNPPAPVVASATGNIEHIWVKPDQWVRRNEPLAVLHNTAKTEHMTSFAEKFAQFEKQFGSVYNQTVLASTGGVMPASDLAVALRKGDQPPEKSVKLEFDTSANLGPLQHEYAEFLGNLADLQIFEGTQRYGAQIDAVRREITTRRGISGTLAKSARLGDRSAAIAREWQQKDRELLEQDVLSQRETQEAEISLHEKLVRRHDTRRELLKNRVDTVNAQRFAADLEQQYMDRRQKLVRQLRASLQRLRGALADWDRRYVLRAPIRGRVVMLSAWAPEQFAKQGDEIMSVVPGKQKLMGRIEAAQRGLGRVKTGQRVRVRLDSYPAEQFGYVHGRVAQIARTTQRDKYIITVSFPEELRTNYGRVLPFRQGLLGRADVVTEDLRLIQRVLYPLRDLLGRSVY